MAVIETTYKVIGMTCQSCAASVESLLKSVPGVESARVHFAAQEVLVRHRVEEASFEALRQVLASAGYDLLPDAQTQRLLHQQYMRRLAKHVVLAGLFVTMGIGFHFLSLPLWVGAVYYGVSLIGVGWIGGMYFGRPAWRQLRVKQLTMDTLISLGIAGSLVLGGVELFQRNAGHAVMAGAEILFFVLLGRYIEEGVRARAQHLLGDFAFLAVPAARRRSGSRIEEVPTHALRVGDIVEVRAQEIFPVDGTIVEGNAAVSESFLTGEPFPVEKSKGDAVWAGSQNLSGTVLVRVEVPIQETVLSQIIRRVSQAQESQSQVQRIADRIAAFFVPIVILLALGAVVYHLWGGAPTLLACERALSVLVISCPCALGLATPIAVQMAVRSAAGARILLQEISQMENLSRATIWAFDKTGTLTYGKASVRTVEWYDSSYTAHIYVALRRSLHPLAQALREYLETQNGAILPEPQLTELPGKGLIATFPDVQLYIGSPVWIREQHPSLDLPKEMSVAVATPTSVVALFTFTDVRRKGLAPFLQSLKREGKRLVLLTGDPSPAAYEVGKEFGFDEIHCGLSPFEKAQWIEKEQAKGEKVVFVGDGINDSIALQTAFVGIAVHQSAGAAARSAGIALLQDTETVLPSVYQLSVRLRRTILQNLLWAFAYNLIAIPAAMGLLPSLSLSPGVSAFLMSLSSLFVVLNSLRLRLR
ncbi:MAG: cation-translocating P-type ATPase [Bacteroidia bacterium]|nr:cation-translocating P-type ATPase [Bacteroidia bacterium]MDW8014453.1 cation-translocating P-type ATPase [Bacteroidia bacterium]